MQDPIAHHLARTSRTFGLTIPMLPPRMRREVGLAYLIFRIADTLEDAAQWSALERVEALERFVSLLDRPDRAVAEDLAARWSEARPVQHEGYLDLIRALPDVLEELGRIDQEARDLIVTHAQRTASGMAHVIARLEESSMALPSLGELRTYCYIVAGVVGEMLTDLFLLHEPWLLSKAALLREEAARFGEGLQLVNILKDAHQDEREGRVFVPAGVDLADVRALAREGLKAAERYACMLEDGGASRGIIAFVATPVTLAHAALRAVEEQGVGARISRRDVAWCVSGVALRLAVGKRALGDAGWGVS